ncbi:MAG: Fe-S cluster assembly protein SufD, partial [Fidelibacterota bacterium]
GSSERNYFTNVVTELVASENASLHHVKLQEESPQASHISATTVLQHAHSRLFTCSISVGGRLIRNDVKIRLDGEGCHCLMNGLVLARSRQHVDNHTFISHDKPHCSSHQLYKGIYDGKSHGVFNGRIHVTKEGQKTDADQTNKNLLLSKDALVNSNPQLEINADDVRCTHGSTTGQIDEEALFYLRTRGLERRVAQMLLIRGFAHEIIDGIPSEVLRHYVDGTLGTWLSDMTRRETA